MFRRRSRFCFVTGMRIESNAPLPSRICSRFAALGQRTGNRQTGGKSPPSAIEAGRSALPLCLFITSIKAPAEAASFKNLQKLFSSGIGVTDFKGEHGFSTDYEHQGLLPLGMTSIPATTARRLPPPSEHIVEV
jgi:hypothetical protein